MDDLSSLTLMGKTSYPVQYPEGFCFSCMKGMDSYEWVDSHVGYTRESLIPSPLENR